MISFNVITFPLLFLGAGFTIFVTLTLPPSIITLSIVPPLGFPISPVNPVPPLETIVPPFIVIVPPFPAFPAPIPGAFAPPIASIFPPVIVIVPH